MRCGVVRTTAKAHPSNLLSKGHGTPVSAAAHEHGKNTHVCKVIKKQMSKPAHMLPRVQDTRWKKETSWVVLLPFSGWISWRHYLCPMSKSLCIAYCIPLCISSVSPRILPDSIMTLYLWFLFCPFHPASFCSSNTDPLWAPNWILKS